MPKQRKLSNPELRAKVEADLKVKTRAEVCKEHGLDYNMIRREFGNAWTHHVGQSNKVEEQVGS